MKTTIDTNLLVRTIVADGSQQAKLAERSMSELPEVVVPLIVLCEAAWILRSIYRKTRREIAEAFLKVLLVRNIHCDREASRFGIAALERGGDFADAVVALEGKRMGADEFLSFDSKAVRVLASLGLETRLLD